MAHLLDCPCLIGDNSQPKPRRRNVRTVLTRVVCGLLATLAMAMPASATDLVIHSPFGWLRIGPRGPFGKHVRVDGPVTRVQVPPPVTTDPPELLHAPRPKADGEPANPPGP